MESPGANSTTRPLKSVAVQQARDRDAVLVTDVDEVEEGADDEDASSDEELEARDDDEEEDGEEDEDEEDVVVSVEEGVVL